MVKKLEDLILCGDFKEAKKLVKKLSFETFYNDLLSTAFDNGSIANYSFVTSLLVDQENEDLQNLAYMILSQPLCHIEGAYVSSFYHAQRAVELTNYKDEGLLENLLFLNIVPEKVVNDDDAKIIARKILLLNPKNEVAKEVLNVT